MATLLDEWPETDRRHDWDTWFDGRIWRLSRAIDFGGTPEEFRRTALRAARARGVKIKTHVRDTQVTIQRLKEEGR